MADFEPYENTLPVSELRRLVRQAWDRSIALNRALLELPEVPPIDALWAIEHAAMNHHSDVHDMFAIGKMLQAKHGYEKVPPKAELEHAAAFWWLIRQGLLDTQGEDR